MKKQINVLIFLIVVSCGKKEQLIDYYSDGKIKMKGDLLNGVRHGVFLEYYSTGKLKFKETWESGKLNGPFEEYSPNGKIYRKGIVKNHKLVEETYFFESGGVHKIQRYGSDGYIEAVQRYKENGKRDPMAYPYPEIHTTRIGDTATFKSRLVNVSNPLETGSV